MVYIRRLCLWNGELEGLIVILVIRKNQVITGVSLYWVRCSVEHLDRQDALHEGQAGFRRNKSCIDMLGTNLKTRTVLKPSDGFKVARTVLRAGPRWL